MSETQAPTENGQGAGSPQAAQAAQAPAAPANPIPWLEGADELTVGYVQNKGWKAPADIIQAYRGAEKFISAPVDKRLVIPQDNQDQKAWDNFYTQLGRPADPSGYKIEVPKGIGDPEFAKTAGSWFHELGLTQKQGDALAAKWNEHITGLGANQETARAQAFEADDRELRASWGAAFQQELTKAQAAVRGLGVTAEQLDALQSAMGHKATMEFFNKIGNKMGEATFVTGEGNEKFGAALTPAMAKDKIQQLKSDKAFVARYAKGDAEAKAELQRLHAFAYPDGE